MVSGQSYGHFRSQLILLYPEHQVALACLPPAAGAICFDSLRYCEFHLPDADATTSSGPFQQPRDLRLESQLR